MAKLTIRNVDDHIVQALKRRAAEHGRSVEAEHRAILEAALVITRRRTLAQALAAMPNVGKDEDFERKGRASYLIDVKWRELRQH